MRWDSLGSGFVVGVCFFLFCIIWAGCCSSLLLSNSITSNYLIQRMYGALTGKSKQMVANEYGEAQLKVSVIKTSLSSWRHKVGKLLSRRATPLNYEEMATRIQNSAATSFVIFPKLPWKWLQANQVCQGSTYLVDGDTQSKYRGEEIPGELDWI